MRKRRERSKLFAPENAAPPSAAFIAADGIFVIGSAAFAACSRERMPVSTATVGATG